MAVVAVVPVLTGACFDLKRLRLFLWLKCLFLQQNKHIFAHFAVKKDKNKLKTVERLGFNIPIILFCITK